MAEELFYVRAPRHMDFWQVLTNTGDPDYPTPHLVALLYDEDVAIHLARTLTNAVKSAVEADRALLAAGNKKSNDG